MSYTGEERRTGKLRKWVLRALGEIHKGEVELKTHPLRTKASAFSDLVSELARKDTIVPYFGVMREIDAEAKKRNSPLSKLAREIHNARPLMEKPTESGDVDYYIDMRRRN